MINSAFSVRKWRGAHRWLLPFWRWQHRCAARSRQHFLFCVHLYLGVERVIASPCSRSVGCLYMRCSSSFRSDVVNVFICTGFWKGRTSRANFAHTSRSVLVFGCCFLVACREQGVGWNVPVNHMLFVPSPRVCKVQMKLCTGWVLTAR